METTTQRFSAYAVVVALFAVAIAAIQGTTDTPAQSGLSVRLTLPDDLGPYRGETLWFCQSDQCARTFPESDLDQADTCPECGEPLDLRSVAEKTVLPPDTIIRKRLYTRPGGKPCLVTIVVGGRERRSIHRPQVCLVAAGQTITDQRVIDVPVPGRAADLPVMLLDVGRTAVLPGGRQVRREMAFAYWFTAPGHETPHHLQRLVQTAADGVIRNRRTRWAYVSVSTERDTAERSAERVRDIVERLYPHITDPRRDRPASAAAQDRERPVPLSTPPWRR
jgi:hypothetical protein